MVSIGFVGAGNMATALIDGILDKGICDNIGIWASDKDDSRLKKLEERFEINATDKNSLVLDNTDVIFIAVKPQDIDMVLSDIKDFVTEEKIIISIAAGISIKKIESVIGKKKIVRVMPNTPCIVGEMAAAFSVNNKMTAQEIETVEFILNSAGTAYKLEEKHLDAVTGLSGSGPAFVAYLIDAFQKAGIKNGLPKDIACSLTLQTFIGTAKLLERKNLAPSQLIDMVSSPNGTTVKGRKILEKSDIHDIITHTVSAAARRSKELGQ